VLKNKLRKYQLEGISIIYKTLQKNRGFLLADETGLGKSVQALKILQKIGGKYSLIVCPANLKLKWEDEIKKWLPNKRPVIIIKSYNECIDPDIRRYLIKHIFDILIIDEVHYLKNFESKRTQAIFGAPALKCKTIANCSKKILGISATPIPQRVGELYPWLWTTQNDIIKNQTFEKFIVKWAKTFRFTKFGLTHRGVRNPEELKKELYKSMLRRKKYEVLSELPPSTRNNIPIEISAEMYVEERELLTELLEKAGYKSSQLNLIIDNPSFLNQLLKTVPSFDQLTIYKHQQGLFKIKSVFEYIKKIVVPDQKKFILFAYHADVAEKYYDLLKEKNLSLTLITGKMDPEERYKLIKKTDKQEENILVATLGAVREGFDLIGYADSYFTELDWAPYVLTQNEGRTLRLGQEKPVTWNYFLYDKGIEKYIFDTLQTKYDTISKILD